MLVVQISMSELRSRGNHIREILEPIRSRSSVPAWKPISSTTRWIIAFHEGAPAQSDYRGWRFSTILPGLRAQYFEWWLRSNEGDKESWYLDRAYLNVFQFDFLTGTETKFLCLHCDPNIVQNDTRDEDENEQDQAGTRPTLTRVEYKKVPHVHLKHGAAKAPFPTKAHISLNVGYAEQALSSLESLSEAMKLGVLMLREEVFDRMIA